MALQRRAGTFRYFCVPLLCGVLVACQSVPPVTTEKPEKPEKRSPTVSDSTAPVNAPVTVPVAPPAGATGESSAPPASSQTSVQATLPATRPAEPFRNIYAQDKDSVPANPRSIDYMTIPDAVPKAEPRGKYGNKSPYKVNGRSYRVLASADGYSAEGMASWYGEKFHGHRTSSFELYDMYAMTAAHTTLPIPSYVRVTNLDNERSVIVRVNDRGPFHHGRIIDLSWAAAQKLGYAGKGTARVRVEAVEPEAGPETSATTLENSAESTAEKPPEKSEATTEAEAESAPQATAPAVTPVVDANATGVEKSAAAAPAKAITNKPPESISNNAHGFFIQLGAFTFPDAARQLGERVRATVGEPVTVSAGDDALHRVRVGPYEDRASAERIRDLLRLADLGTPALVFVPAPASP